jgi:hypothetical protein
MAPTTSPPDPHRWFQFRLRTLFVVMVLASVGLSFFAKCQQAWRQREAVAAIRAMKGTCLYDYQAAGFVFAPAETDRAPARLRMVLGDDFVSRVVLVHLPDKAGLGHLDAFPHLAGLSFHDAPITDADMRLFKRFPHLEFVDLSNTQVSDAGLEPLRDLTQLESLMLYGTRVTAEGQQSLQEALPNCRIYR